ncbi:MAG: hypothetical protein AB7E79_02520 [Rhodospirillaceae bacterium]
MNVKLEKRGALWTVIAVAVVSAYQSLYFLAPDFLAIPLWEGSSLTIAFLLGTLSVAIPVAVGWWMIKEDKADVETFDVTHH